MPYATLLERSLLILQGDDTLSFLQGLLSNDVLKLAEKKIVYTAMLTPQGKFLHDFFVMDDGDRVLIDVARARRDELKSRLIRYRLRTKVSIEADDSRGIVAVWGQVPSQPGLKVCRDPRAEALGWRALGDVSGFDGVAGDYTAHRIAVGVPQGDDDLVAGKSFILPFGFEDLHGVDFAKGCYVGQEVTARSKHLATLRKFIYKVHSEAPLPPAGTPVMRGEANVGELRSSSGTAGLALLSVEEVLKQVPLVCAGQVLQVSVPEWVKAKLA